MAQYLPDDFDLETFDFRVGKYIDNGKRAKKRKDDYNFGKDFSINGNNKPSRQTKKARENIRVQVINSNKDAEKEQREEQRSKSDTHQGTAGDYKMLLV